MFNTQDSVCAAKISSTSPLTTVRRNPSRINVSGGNGKTGNDHNISPLAKVPLYLHSTHHSQQMTCCCCSCPCFCLGCPHSLIIQQPPLLLLHSRSTHRALGMNPHRQHSGSCRPRRQASGGYHQTGQQLLTWQRYHHHAG